MIETIEKLLDNLCCNVEEWNVHINKYETFYLQDNKPFIRYSICFKIDNKYYNIDIINDIIEVSLHINNKGSIGSIYKVKIPTEDKQRIIMKLEVLLNFCLEYTKNSFKEIVFDNRGLKDTLD